MPTITVNGAELYYEEHGDGQTILFAHGLLWSGQMFVQQVNAFKDRYRCITFDFRGQGRSEVTEDGYDMDTLTEDTVALIDTLECAPCHVVGLSMGGFVGMRLGIRHPDLLRSLILIETSADPEPSVNKIKYRLLSTIARRLGLELVVDRVMPIMFGETFMRDESCAALRAKWRQRLLTNDRIGITRAVEGVITRDGVYDQIHQIDVPTLIIVGEEDVATPPEKAERIHARIPESELRVIPGAGHTSTVEAPEAINAAIEAFLADGAA